MVNPRSLFSWHSLEVVTPKLWAPGAQKLRKAGMPIQTKNILKLDARHPSSTSAVALPQNMKSILINHNLEVFCLPGMAELPKGIVVYIRGIGKVFMGHCHMEINATKYTLTYF
ncbi:hypothetical protein E2C01_042658 [Portunus trituberculatus]|uniref:Uncharacterized protein n=1 Tax=Portunus trituberculatus TaxID=210409 RepID=A0A5B7FMY6_PORTR|nr:hypothetical protein [Portunus trituberculatus]